MIDYEMGLRSVVLLALLALTASVPVENPGAEGIDKAWEETTMDEDSNPYLDVEDFEEKVGMPYEEWVQHAKGYDPTVSDLEVDDTDDTASQKTNESKTNVTANNIYLKVGNGIAPGAVMTAMSKTISRGIWSADSVFRDLPFAELSVVHSQNDTNGTEFTVVYDVRHGDLGCQLSIKVSGEGEVDYWGCDKWAFVYCSGVSDTDTDGEAWHVSCSVEDAADSVMKKQTRRTAVKAPLKAHVSG